MISEIFMQINRILTKLRQLKLRGPVIKPHRVICLFVIHSLCNVKWTSVKVLFTTINISLNGCEQVTSMEQSFHEIFSDRG